MLILLTLQSTWRVALYKIFRVHDVNNLLYIQSCMSILAITFAVDLRKLVFLHKLSVHVMSTVHTVFLLLLLQNMNSYVRSTALRKNVFSMCVTCVCRFLLCFCSYFCPSVCLYLSPATLYCGNWNKYIMIWLVICPSVNDTSKQQRYSEIFQAHSYPSQLLHIMLTLDNSIPKTIYHFWTFI